MKNEVDRCTLYVILADFNYVQDVKLLNNYVPIIYWFYVFTFVYDNLV
jgi:hypothetical protein